MARYEQLVADDEIAARGATHVDIVAQQERAKKRKLFREKIERLLWVLVSAFLVWFGDGTSDLGQIMLQRANDTRCVLTSRSARIETAGAFWYRRRRPVCP